MSADSRTKDKPSTLASRPSFFGGVVSTRQASAVSTWKPPKTTKLSQSPAGGSKNASAEPVNKPKGPAGSSLQSAKSAPPVLVIDPILLKQQRLKASRNFDSDSDNEADKSKPDAYSQALAKLQQQDSKHAKEADAKRSYKSNHPDSTQCQQQSHNQAAGSPAKHVSKNRVVLPKGKAGAASRKMALAPQAISLSRKQMADRGIRQAVDSIRSTAPSPPPQRPPSSNPQTSPSTSRSSNQTGRPVAAANRVHSSAGATTSGRPQFSVHASSTARPQSSHAGTTQPTMEGIVRQQHTDFFRHPDAQHIMREHDRRSKPRPELQQMPAWMQKAKAALAGQKRSRREESGYDDDFVVDDHEEEDWRQALKSVTRYDPSKFNDQGFDDHSMEANWREIQAEERRSARLGRDDDARAEMEELRHQEDKKQKKKKARTNGLLM